MCLPKEQGGLGFKHLYAHNLAMLSKQGWRFLSNPTLLVARVFKAVYYPNGSFLTADLGDRPSYSWRSILEARSTLQVSIFRRIGNGTSVNIWTDEWILNVAAHSISRLSETVFEYVADLLDPSTGSWDNVAVHACFVPDIATHILTIPLSRRFRVDKIAWKFDKKGWFSVKYAYKVARAFSIGHIFASTSNGDPYAQLWKALWKAKVPNKVAIFGWRAAHNLLPTRVALTAKAYTGETSSCLVANALAWYEEFLQANICGNPSQGRHQLSKKWEPPVGDVLKLNVDEAYLLQVPYGGTGGVLRNMQGSPLHSELMALKQGVQFLHSMRVTSAVIESDCQVAVVALTSEQVDLSQVNALIAEVKDLLTPNAGIRIQFVPRQANNVAHRLASHGFESNVNHEWFVNTPELLLDALMYDLNRIH
ncbi:uncharacterized protein LOC133711538 [Rosa rugosa]|uniref:uncharacterized protein LOC133711538 n=1 Tax=Rosa rugosa TaxID=74645 RepID=UPI002B40C2AC|nr:uncharacterized protein LOC133711538 [Rosa rugosa]